MTQYDGHRETTAASETRTASQQPLHPITAGSPTLQHNDFGEQRKEGSERPPLAQLMAYAAQNKLFDVVVVWKLDRFGRSTPDTLANINVARSALRAFCGS